MKLKLLTFPPISDAKYSISIFYNTFNLVLFAYAIIEETVIEMIVSTALTILGFVLRCYLLCQTFLYYRATFAPTFKYKEIKYQLKEYMTFKRLPLEFQEKMLKYFDYEFHQKFYRSQEILHNAGEKVCD